MVSPSLKKNNALKYAVNIGCFSSIKILLEDDIADPSFDNNKLMYIAIKDNNINIIKLLLEDKRIKYEKNGKYFVLAAFENDFIEIGEYLLKDKRLEPSHDELINTACRRGYYKLIEILSKNKTVNFYINDNYPIKCASECGHLNIVKFILNTSGFNYFKELTYHDEELDPEKLDIITKLYERIKNIFDIEYSNHDYIKLLRDTKNTYELGHTLLLNEWKQRCDLFFFLLLCLKDILPKEIVWKITGF